MFKKILIRALAETIVEVMIEVLQDRANKSRSQPLKNLVKTLSDDRVQLKADLIAKVR